MPHLQFLAETGWLVAAGVRRAALLYRRVPARPAQG
jgi:hypothetical protein